MYQQAAETPIFLVLTDVRFAVQYRLWRDLCDATYLGPRVADKIIVGLILMRSAGLSHSMQWMHSCTFPTVTAAWTQDFSFHSSSCQPVAQKRESPYLTWQTACEAAAEACVHAACTGILARRTLGPTPSTLQQPSSWSPSCPPSQPAPTLRSWCVPVPCGYDACQHTMPLRDGSVSLKHILWDWHGRASASNQSAV